MVNCWCAHKRVILVFKHKPHNTTRLRASPVRHGSTYIISFLTWHNEAINDDGNDDRHTSIPCPTRSVYILLMNSQSIADDVTMTSQLWRDYVNSDIEFVRYRLYPRRYSRPVVSEIHIPNIWYIDWHMQICRFLVYENAWHMFRKCDVHLGNRILRRLTIQFH